MASKKQSSRKTTSKRAPSSRKVPSNKSSKAAPPVPAIEATDEIAREPAFPVVGIGASAGGLDALKKLFGAMPNDTGMAFVVVPHLDPKHKSLMVELLAKQTDMPVCEAEEGMAIQPNMLHVIPHNKFLAIRDRVLHLSKLPQPQGLQTAIDSFLRSLADDVKELAIGIVLSGTGSHGTLGIQAIKGHGGMAMVQEPGTADYDHMPQNAIATGVVDYILPPEEMPAALVQFASHVISNGMWCPAEVPSTELDQLTRVLALLRARTSYDFRCYRKNMLMRRVQRRMGLCQIDNLTDYLEYVRANAGEVTLLFRDMLIGVTAFYREPEAYKVLEQRVIPNLAEESSADKPIRIWVPGCATGEEAYSIAMSVLDQFAAANRSPNFQIFATDIDENALEFARQGMYPESIAADVSPDQLKQYFTKTDHHYVVNKQVRESVVFAAQNLVSDAPFSKLDLISCRNLLIYLEPDVQRNIIALFHFALKPEGYLFLGSSETVGGDRGIFQTISKRWRVFRRTGPMRRDLLTFPVATGEERRGLLRLNPQKNERNLLGFVELMQRSILADYAPASVLINRKYEVLCVQGPMVNFMEFPSGELTSDLLAMTRPGLRTKLRAACHKAIRDNQTVIDDDCRVKRDGAYAPCTLTVKMIAEPKEAENLLLVTFQEQPKESAELHVADAKSEPVEESALFLHMENELKSTREDLQSTIEEMESANEELKASHEELMSMNEELQSANEELETSKEELQSMNEELSTVNNQLRDKIIELEGAYNDMANLLANTDVATVFLDIELNIQRFTPSTGKLLKLIATDVGRPMSVFAGNLNDEGLLGDAQQVLDGLTPIEKEILTDDSKSYIRRIVPYRTQDNRIEGVVITFSDITEHKRAEKVLRDVAERKTLERAMVEFVENEQRRIGLELHDDVGQQVTAMGLLASNLQGHLGAESSALKGKAADIIKAIQQTSEKLRKLTAGLVSVEIDAQGLVPALEKLVEGQSLSGLNCQFDCDNDIEIKDNLIALQLYRITQEAVNNVVKHANAKNLAISLRDGDGIHVEICDDGIGFDPAKLDGNGNGLGIMRYRADLIGGTMTIESQRGKGTVLVCSLPHSN